MYGVEFLINSCIAICMGTLLTIQYNYAVGYTVAFFWLSYECKK